MARRSQVTERPWPLSLWLISAENSKDGHQQKKPLRVADPAALAALRQALKKTDQIGLIGSGNMRLGQGSEAMRPSQPQEKGRRQGEAG